MTLSRVYLCLFVLTGAAVLSSSRATSTVLYTKINGTETLSCECPDNTCQQAFWYRYLKRRNAFQFLMYVNSANRETPAEDLNDSRFKGSVSSGQRPVYSLRITGLQEDDAGFYSCIFQAKYIMPVGYHIMPGVNPPTLHPPTVKIPRTMTPCKCKPHKISPKGCADSVLWPGVGALLLLAVTVMGTLYYFSRLPKKCRHRFTKTNPLR